MTKFSYDWFIAQSREAQDDIKNWPAAMKTNIRVGVATLPVLGELRSKTHGLEVDGEEGQQADPEKDGRRLA
jgi:hypothetical protein